ncbi:hypothetical protein B0H16DRAFT_414894 [Mycena metata]|uniref:Uncharacterized protein n=1 Tax=Mycena metata TaxID=1033252 RepID=A0AAD7NL24_9AGAR|nr:hypothetical protein B0H16DRAFT_414894 [Mycena metata]
MPPSKLSIAFHQLTFPSFRYAICGCTQVPANNGPIQITAHENLDASCQMWSFGDYKFKQPEHKQPESHPPGDHKQTESRNSEQSPKAQAMNAGLGAVEMEMLTAKHSIDIKNLREEITKAIAAMGAKLDHTMKDMEKRAKEEEDRKYQVLLQFMRAQVCHWESSKGTFRSVSFRSAPIESGVRDGVTFFVMRIQMNTTGSVYITDIGEGRLFDNHLKDRKFWVLAGHASHFRWAPCRGRFKAQSVGYNLVPGWDKEEGKVGDTMFIARFTESGNVYVTHVKEGQNGVSKKIDEETSVKGQDYEVLCYKDL